MSRDAIRFLYRGAVGAATLAALPLRARDGRTAVFYGGARAGDFGGTLVKVRLLQGRFPERWIGYSLIYVLSNAIYLPQSVLDAVRSVGVPLVLNQNGVFYPGWYPHGWEQQNARMAKVHASADHVLYQSEFCRRCAEKFLGARTGNSEILYNAVDTKRFVPRPAGERRGPFNFLVTGKFGPSTAYRISSSISGLSAARQGGLDVRLTIAGIVEPGVMTFATRQLEQLGLTDFVEFLGPYTGAQASAIYQRGDAYLMTKHNDPCPNVVLEALACGLPVLYSASGGVPELVGNEAGLGLAVPETFEQDVAPTPAAIADGMAKIMQARDTMALAARERVIGRFDIAHWFARHEAVFTNLLRQM